MIMSCIVYFPDRFSVITTGMSDSVYKMEPADSLNECSMYMCDGTYEPDHIKFQL